MKVLQIDQGGKVFFLFIPIPLGGAIKPFLPTPALVFNQIAEAKVLHGHDAWGPLAIADGKLLARDSRQMVCIDVRAH